MPKFTTNNSIDIDEMIRQSKANVPFVDEETLQKNKAMNQQAAVSKGKMREEAPVDAEVVNEAPSAMPGLILEDEEDSKPSEPETEYTGPGIVMSAEEYMAGKAKTEAKGVNVSGVKAETRDAVKQYMKEQDEEINALRKKKEEMEAKGVAPIAKKTSPQEIVNIYIDKAQVGNIALTPEQQKKVEMAQKIVINETTELQYKTIKIRKADVDKDVARKKKDRVIKHAFDRTLSPFVAIGSGYLGKMGNGTTIDILKLGHLVEGDNSLQSQLDRWSLLYDKMKYCSIGKFETFDDFLKNTAYTDYANLQFAFICATFPEDTTLQFTCPKCKAPFNFTIKNRDLLRTDMVTQEIADQVHAIIDADTFIERAKEVHEKSLFNEVTRISANEDDNLILMDLYIPSAYDAIHRTYEELVNPKKDDEDYSDYVDIVRMVKAIYIADEDEDGEPIYEMFDDVNDIFEIVSHFNEQQLNKISQFINNSFVSHQYTYGIKDVVCPNPDCKHHLGEYPMNMDLLLFHKVRPRQQ